MPLTKKYGEDFERIWHVYPKWPTGRSKKDVAHRAFEKAKKEFGFTAADIDELVELIEKAKLERESWQTGHTYGPQGLQTWLNQRAWMDGYQTVRAAKPRRGNVSDPDLVAQRMGYASFEDYQKGIRH